MTVFDENLNGEEYSDMEFEEFLEYLVRISYVLPYADEEERPASGMSDQREPCTVPVKIKLAARVK